MRSVKMLLAIAGVVAVAGSTSVADVFMRQISHTDEIKIMGRTQPASTDTASIWLAKDMAAMGGVDGRVIFRADKDYLYVIDDVQKTYQAISLKDVQRMTEAAGEMSEQMAKAMEGVSAEDKAKMKEAMEKLNDNPQMKAMAEKMLGNATGDAAGATEESAADKPFMKVTITPTSETKTINGWDTKKYTGTMEMAMGTGTAEVWAAPSLKIDADLYNTLQTGMMAGGKGFDEAVKEMSKIDGVPVYSIHKMNVMGTNTASTTELIEFKKDVQAPAGTFEIPEGYKKIDMPTMGGMGQ